MPLFIRVFPLRILQSKIYHHLLYILYQGKSIKIVDGTIIVKKKKFVPEIDFQYKNSWKVKNRKKKWKSTRIYLCYSFMQELGDFLFFSFNCSTRRYVANDNFTWLVCGLHRRKKEQSEWLIWRHIRQVQNFFFLQLLFLWFSLFPRWSLACKKAPEGGVLRQKNSKQGHPEWAALNQLRDSRASRSLSQNSQSR